MRADGVWCGNSAWPCGSSPGAFARDVFRIEGCKSDREKAFAFNKWLLRCMNRGPNMSLPGLGGYIHSADPTLLFTSWGHNECTGWGWVAAEALQAAGVKARRAVAFNFGHTFYEVWYKGVDGKEGWHAFDPFQGWYFLNDAGEVASCEELAANPDLVTNPRPGGPSRLGHHPERSQVLHRYKVQDLIDVIQPVQGHELRFEPRVGQTFSSLWRPEIPDLAIKSTSHPTGAHCDISLYDEEGKARYPEHLPYWKNYVWPTPNTGHTNGGQPVRWHGCGNMRWQPLRFGEAMAEHAEHAVFEDGTLRPTGPKRHCEVWWRVRLPYLATYLRVAIAADASGGDRVGVSISPDAGRSRKSLYWGAGVPPKTVASMPEDSPGVRGMQDFWIGMDMSSQSSDSPLRVRGLQFNVGYQLNMNILPRLLPGANDLYLQADSLDGAKLAAEWAFTLPEGERVETVELDKPGRAEKKVELDVGRPEDVVMRGVALKCLPE